MSDGIKIREREDGRFYEAWTVVGGVKHSVVFERDPVLGWPTDYKGRVHAKITRVAACSIGESQ